MIGNSHSVPGISPRIAAEIGQAGIKRGEGQDDKGGGEERGREKTKG